MDNKQTKKFFLYARKSTDEPERQILSIEAQLFELREYAKKENLNIVKVCGKQNRQGTGQRSF